MKPFYAINAPTSLFNRFGSFQFPDDGWCHLVPKGEFPHAKSGVLQVFDDVGLQAMVKNFHTEAEASNFPGIRGDFDHFSYDDDKPTEASCWVQDVQIRDNGLWGKLKLTHKGRMAAEGGEYRLVSPTFRPAECDIVENRLLTNAAGEKDNKPIKVRPLRLDSIAFCNNPNLLGMVPISNRDTPLDKPEAETKDKRMKSVCEHLGLSPDASEEAVLAEVKKNTERAKQADVAHEALKNRNSKLETENAAMLTAVVDGDLERLSNRFAPASKDQVRKMMLENREATLAFLEALPEMTEAKKQGAEKVIHNRDQASVTDLAKRNAASNTDADNQTADEKSAQNARAKNILNRANELLAQSKKNRNGRTFDQCWRAAESEIMAKN